MRAQSVSLEDISRRLSPEKLRRFIDWFDWIDYPQMWLNYQIGHHLIPHLPMTKDPASRKFKRFVASTTFLTFRRA